jgi:AraC-like DNA-binding protein
MKDFFYESHRDIGADYFTAERGQDLSFPLHMHRCFEIILVLEGSMRVRVEQENFALRAGDMILIKPNRVHSLETIQNSRHKLCIFSSELIAAIASPLKRHPLTSPILRDVPRLYRELFESIEESASIGGIKGFLYSICDLFCKQLDLSREEVLSGKDHLIRDMLRYAEKNMNAPCTLAATAAALGYSESYLSRSFGDTVGMSYTAYVRQVKINHACYLLKNTGLSVTDIVNQCGFSSVATFNHSFKELTGCSPTEYRKKNRV